MEIKSPNLTLNLGTYDVATKRREAYEKAVKKEGARSMNEWVKKVLDKASGFTQ